MSRETCDSCGGDDRTCEMRPACPYCGTVLCTLCVNENGECCDGDGDPDEP